jgi:hypothetical protein
MQWKEVSTWQERGWGRAKSGAALPLAGNAGGRSRVEKQILSVEYVHGAPRVLERLP